MSFFDDFPAGSTRLSKEQAERKRERDTRIRAGLTVRESWSKKQFEEESIRLEKEVSEWLERAAA
ncbi:hypothetical protein M3P21_08785 [Ruegeria sp. 2012CJ41-6]|uniref:Uncharacterized protein n=1 Tax=Ruegeria spongiae TaxID=2942209 RepID=A0ABT0Q1C5_9RHOB|nr:hypothetical protein [Ruegeria spongiae]MCL6283625.1 hypothetical protein [Ruegeria spongiae]